jgi:hypothetical protein
MARNDENSGYLAYLNKLALSGSWNNQAVKKALNWILDEYADSKARYSLAKEEIHQLKNQIAGLKNQLRVECDVEPRAVIEADEPTPYCVIGRTAQQISRPDRKWYTSRDAGELHALQILYSNRLQEELLVVKIVSILRRPKPGIQTLRVK